MGFPDLPPPSSSTCSSLKRCRSADAQSFLAELCSPPPKLPFNTHIPHHLSVLHALENSLNSTPADAPTPEELVAEMMHSLEKVMGDIGELISPSSESQSCPNMDSAVCAGDSEASSLQEPRDLAVCSHDQRPSSSATSDLLTSPCERLILFRDAAEGDAGKPASDICTNATALVLSDSLDDFGDIAASDCNVASVSESSDLFEIQARNICAGSEECARHGCEGLDNIQRLLDLSDDELEVMHGALELPVMLVTEQGHAQWSLLDEFTGDVVAVATATSNGDDERFDWFDDGYGVSAFSLSQVEEEGFL